MAFNVVARNQDDHVKNIAFLMDRAGVDDRHVAGIAPTLRLSFPSR